MGKYVLIALISGVMSALAQVLLKKSSGIKRETRIAEYLNKYVISGYAIMFGCMILMVIAYRGLPLKYVAVLETLVYLYSMILGKMFFDEKITKKKLIGNLLIVAGIIVFSLT